LKGSSNHSYFAAPVGHIHGFVNKYGEDSKEEFNTAASAQGLGLDVDEGERRLSCGLPIEDGENKV
jgi:hypothetical protein